MKISYMQKRENFYEINKKTLEQYYGDKGKETDLYIFPELNTITVAHPSKKVKEYIYTEFSVNASPVKKLIVRIYSRALMNSAGLFSSAKLRIKTSADADTLIYPCNKKYRIFEFDKNEVTVFAKYGFNNNDLKNEIEFRTREDIPDFVPKIIEYNERGYKEKIIDGKPLARIETNFDVLRVKAYEMFFDYAKKTIETVSASGYAEELIKEINNKITDKVACRDKLDALKNRLAAEMSKTPEINLCFSHGDLQAGNIWIENKTQKIYIIDWESWSKRSVWYDKAMLFGGLRPYGAAQYIAKDIPSFEKAAVLMEDIIFNLNDLNNLPANYGEDQFAAYINGLYEQII